MNRKAYWSIPAIIVSALIFSTVTFLTSCSSSSSKPSSVVTITPVSGTTPQSATVGTAYATQLAATVTTNGTPTSGVSVTFTAPSMGASGTFATSTPGATDTETTNSSGVATSQIFTANTTAGTYTVMATATGATASASFSLSNTAGTPTTLTATSGGGQSANINTAFANPLVATVTDADSNPVMGVMVTFTAPPSSTASGLFADNGSPSATDTETTDANGNATSTTFTANVTVGGPYNVVATSGTLTAVNFALTNTMPSSVITVTPVAGTTPQSAAINTPFATQLAATVMTNGTPTSGVVVTFTAPPTTGASGTFADTTTSTTTATTNGSGVAQAAVFTADATAGSYIVTATAPGASTNGSFALTNTAPPPLAAGSYVYYVAGEDSDPTDPGLPYFAVGVFTVDSSGAVTGGEQTFLDCCLFGTAPLVAATSSVVAGNNGNVLITLDTGTASVGVNGVETFDVNMVSTTSGLLTEYDTWASGSGTLDLQTSTAAPAGGYAFFTGGLDGNIEPIVIGGVINVDSVGGISGAGSVFDENDDGTTSPDQAFAASTVSAPDAMGQVTFTLNPMIPSDTVAEFTMVGYIVDANTIRWVESGNDALFGDTGGVALGQNGKNGQYGSGSLSGSSGVFWAVGADDNGPLQEAGLLTFNSDGSLAGNLSYNDLVVASAHGGNSLVAGGMWVVDPSGTGRVTMANVSDGTVIYNYQLYLAHNGGTVISMDTGDWTAGLGYGQAGSGAFTTSSFNGNYAMSFDQQDTDTTTGFEFDGIGAIAADGATTSFAGFADVNGAAGNPGTPLTPTNGTAGSVTGAFTVNANGVFPGSISGISSSGAASDSFTFYMIGATSGASVGVIGIEDDLTDQLTLGTFVLQQ